MVPRQKTTRAIINTEQTKQRLTEVRSIYLDHNPPDTKNSPTIRKKLSREEKINADELIKVLQNGKERRNQRRNKNDEDIIETPTTGSKMKKNLSLAENNQK